MIEKILHGIWWFILLVLEAIASFFLWLIAVIIKSSLDIEIRNDGEPLFRRKKKIPKSAAEAHR